MKNKGFSLIELVVVVSITLVSIHGISQIYSNILIKKEVEKETENEEEKLTEENSLGPAGDIGKKTIESSEENAENP